MKILILSMPRCYTKNLQHCISKCLPDDQISAIRLNGDRQGHLGEILHFNECAALGIDKDTKKVMSWSVSNNLQHYIPYWKNDSFYYEPCEMHYPVNIDKWYEAINHIKTSRKSCVAKFFPFKFTARQFSLSDSQAESALDDLISVFDIVIPVLRMNVFDRNISHSTSIIHGWDKRKEEFNYNDIKTPTKEQCEMWQNYENNFRKQCADRNLNIIWSEQLKNGGHYKILADYGIKCTVPFPNATEYSKFKTIDS